MSRGLLVPFVFALIAFGCFGVLVYLTRARRHPRRDTIAVPSDGLKFCRDCRWASPPVWLFSHRDYTQARCMHPTSVKSRGEFLASGQYDPEHMYYCVVMRMVTTPNHAECGETGQYWEPRSARQENHP